MAKINEQLQTNLTNVVSKIFTLAKDHWVNAKDYPISKLCEEYSVDRRYSTAIGKVLREKGLMFSEGEKSGMKYKIDYFSNAHIPSYSHLAELIVEQYRADLKAYNDSRKSDDCRPLRYPKEKVEVMPANFTKCSIPHLGENRFCLIANRIFECKIIGKRQSHDEHILLFEVEVPTKSEKDERLFIDNITLNNLFESVDTLLIYLSKKVTKFK